VRKISKPTTIYFFSFSQWKIFFAWIFWGWWQNDQWRPRMVTQCPRKVHDRPQCPKKIFFNFFPVWSKNDNWRPRMVTQCARKVHDRPQCPKKFFSTFFRYDLKMIIDDQGWWSNVQGRCMIDPNVQKKIFFNFFSGWSKNDNWRPRMVIQCPWNVQNGHQCPKKIFKLFSGWSKNVNWRQLKVSFDVGHRQFLNWKLVPTVDIVSSSTGS
jgi:hypothetical protein